MNAAKVRLSETEMDLVNNADWILTKNGILEKVKTLFGILQEQQAAILATEAASFPEQVLATSPKLSRGENYMGLPYMVLDYPRYFDKEHIFAIRTMFWWGNFFSVTLQLSGRFKNEAASALLNFYKQSTIPSEKENSEIYVCVNENEWEHHFEKSNYLPIAEINHQQWINNIAQKPFIKLATKISLQKWKSDRPIQDVLADAFGKMMLALKTPN